MDICWILQCYFFGSKYPTRRLNTQQVPQIYWVLALDTYGINGKYPIHVYPIYANLYAQTDERTDGTYENNIPLRNTSYAGGIIIKVYIDNHISTLFCANIQCIGAYFCTSSPPCRTPPTELPVGRSYIGEIFHIRSRNFI